MSAENAERVAQIAESWVRLFGYPSDLAETKATSELLVPRSPQTHATFESVEREIYVPALKEARFRKSGLRWTRERDDLLFVVAIQRGKSFSDLLTFTTNWEVRVPRLSEALRPLGNPHGTVVSGRIGQFLEAGRDWWWSIQVGWLARDHPTISADPAECKIEIANGLARTLTWFDEIGSIDAIVPAAEQSVPHSLWGGRRSRLQQVAHLLRPLSE